MKPVFGLVDCNNCYVSAERIFSPYLRAVPVVVLSSNDGCIIARSNEAKKLGLKMGDPYFKVERLCDKEGVVSLSSNFALYADVSQRVMSVISDCVPAVEVYSIDEVFIQLTGIPNATELCREIRRKVKQWTDMPVSIGVGDTKTLAKAMNKIAKKSTKADGVVVTAGRPDLVEVALRRLPVDDVWGVGRRYAERLIGMGIKTAHDLAEMEPKWIQREFGSTLTKTVLELQGTPVFDLDTQPEPRQSCTVSRSFGEPVKDIEQVVDAIREFAQTAAARLRSEGMAAGHLQVFAATNRFRNDVVQGTLSASAPLRPATADSGRIVRTALDLARSCHSFPEGCEFKNAGVLLTDLVLKENIRQDLFTVVDTRKSDKLMGAIDAVNSRFGRQALGLGMTAEGSDEWRTKREKLTPAWTTRWDEIPVVKAE
jgi:DNA polymerase V